MRVVQFLLWVSISQTLTAQHVLENADSLNKKRLLLTSIGYGGIASSSVFALNGVWYSDYETTKLHSFNDSKNWLQVDKVGHAFTAYQLNEVISKSFHWSGVRAEKAAWLGAGYAWSYQFAIEILDGRSSGWGFSWSDLGANTLGCALYLGQELALKKQLIQFKFSYRNSGLSELRPNILGSNFQERLLKDYNAQTYWLSFSPAEAFKLDKFPKWLNLAVGYSAHNKIIGDEEVFVTPSGESLHSSREFILSLDVNTRLLPIKRKWLKALVSPLNVVKIPMPALLWRGNVLYGRAIY